MLFEWHVWLTSECFLFLVVLETNLSVQKAVMISHQNVIANVIQMSISDQKTRKSYGPGFQDVALGLLPQSHIYSLIAVCHLSTYRGDSVIVLPKFEFNSYLDAIQKYRISTLYLVPPIIIGMINNSDKLLCFDLSSVKQVYSAAASLSKEVAEQLLAQHPNWQLRQAYGMTETCVAVSVTNTDDVWPGSSGTLLPGFNVRLVRADGTEITSYNEPGELLVNSPSVALGYLNNDSATRETFHDLPGGRYIRTGDEVEIRCSPKGNEHLWIVDRIKELIKVKVRRSKSQTANNANEFRLIK